MAKWRLTQPHYLNVPGTTWRYEETDQTSGERAEKVFTVPRLLDPSNPRDCNRDGDCIVFHGEGPSTRGLYPFLGDPTPDMEPVDDEATEISASFQDKWQHPIDTLPSNGDYSASLINAFEKQLAKAITNAGGIPVSLLNAPLTGISPEAFAELQATVENLAKQNAALAAQIAAKPEATGRRA